MKKITLIKIILLTSSIGFAQNISKEFEKQLETSKMTFSIPKDLISVQPIKNPQMNYEMAYSNKEKDFEIRYSVRPLNEIMEQYEKSLTDNSITIVNPNTIHNALFLATIMNVSDNKTSEYSEFPKEAVKNEFNADWGATTGFKVENEFLTGFEVCVVTTIHKDNCANAYIFFLGNDMTKLTENMIKYYHQLKFKN